MFLAYLPALVLAFSGLAVGYILWHRDSFQDDALRQKLMLQNAEMKQSLTLAKASYEALDERFTRQRGQLGVLQQLCDDWSASRDQAEQDRQQLDIQLAERTKRNEELVDELQTTRDKAIRLEDSVHSLTQQQLAKLSQVESSWHQKHVKVESALAQHQSNEKVISTDRDNQRKKLHKAEARIAELESELKSNATTLTNAMKNASGLKKEHVSLESALSHSKELLARAEGQCAAERSEKESLVEQLAAAQKQALAWQEQVDELKVKNVEMDGFRQKADSLVLSLGNANGQLEKVLVQRDSALTNCLTLETSMKGLQTRIDNQEASIHRLRKCQDDALENLKHELKVRSEIEAKYDARLTQQKAELEQGIADLKDTSSKQKQDFDTEVEMLHEVAEQELIGLKKSLDQANTTIAKLKKVQTQDSQKLQGFADLQLQFAQRDTQLNELSLALKANSSDYQQQIAKLESHREQLSADLESARQQLQSQLKQDSQTIGQLQAERNDLRTEVDRLHQKMAELQEAIADQQRSQKQIAADSGALAAAVAKSAQLTKELDRREKAIKHLQAESNELARLRDDHAASLRRQAELQARLDSMMSDHLTQKRLNEQIANHEKTIAELRSEIAERANARAAEEQNATLISFSEAIQQRKESSYDAEYGGHVRRDSTRGIVFTEAPESRDDLKRISGIATVLENRLNEFGIYTFKQIMEWQPEEIEEFSRLLTFRDRIERDDWQGQARFFYRQKRDGSKVA